MRFFSCAVFSCAGGVPIQDITQEQYQRIVENNIKNLKPTLSVGIVKDEKGQPIAGAIVKIEWCMHTTDKEKFWKRYAHESKTDDDGRYSFSCDRLRVGTVSAQKQNYAQTLKWKATFYAGGGGVHTNDFTLRKRGVLSFLLRSPDRNDIETGWFSVRGTNRLSGAFDLLSKIGEKTPGTATQYCDLMIDIEHEPTNNLWQVVFSSTNVNDGVIMTDELLYEAPEKGYGRAIKFSVADTGKREMFFYLRTRNPTVYSRIKLRCDGLDEYKIGKTLGFFYLITVNPYGERTFEYDERVDQFWREKPQWVEDAKAALREGRYPEKIDIDALIKAEKETGKK
jgi:hypothetical protein